MPAGMNWVRNSSKSSSAQFNFISQAYCVRLDRVASGDPVTALLVWWPVDDTVALTGALATFAWWSSEGAVLIGANGRWTDCASALALIVSGTQKLRLDESQTNMAPMHQHSPSTNTVTRWLYCGLWYNWSGRGRFAARFVSAGCSGKLGRVHPTRLSSGAWTRRGTRRRTRSC